MRGALAAIVIGCALPAQAAPWASGFGSIGADIGSAVAVDAAGNIYTAGTFNGSATFGTKQLVSAGMRDIFLMKTASDGAIQWVYRFGSTGDEAPQGIVLDAAGNIYLCGTFSGSGSFGGAATQSAGGADGFIAKYSPSGTFVWSRTLGGVGTDQVNGIALDLSQQAIIATGTFQATVTFTPTTTISSQNGGADSFLAKYSSATGAPLWAKSWGSIDYDIGSRVFVDKSDNVLLVGWFAYQINFGVATISAYPGTRDVYIAKIAPSVAAPSTALWAKRYGMVNHTQPFCAGVDSNGDLIVGGIFANQTDVGSGMITGTASAAFLAKYSGASGDNLWAHALPANPSIVPFGVSLDTANNPTVCGNYAGTFNFGPQTFTSVGSSDVFVTKYAGATGAPTWAKSFGGVGSDSGSAIAVDAADRSVVTGYFYGTATFGSVSLTAIGFNDIFLLSTGGCP